ncbi:aspartate/glutamate racemase family protein [Streptomyces sp. NPDC048566]|uniref:aspartate/glutamate racemase family protein n=1 Tax=Streptomyces sp. NPDC048566 TaxID=3365569 RepID=UPI003715414D
MTRADGPAVIGLLGGMSWPSTLAYYRALNEGVAKALGGSHSARVVIWSQDYAEVERLQLSGDWDGAGDLLAAGARGLEAAGADLVAIACNTMHRVSGAVRAACDLPLVDIVEVTAEAARQRGISRAAVLGTRFTAGGALFDAALTARGVEPVLPGPADQALIDRIIYDELCRGSVTDAATRAFTDLRERLRGEGVDGVILACTELGLLLPTAEHGRPAVLDTVDVHVEALVAASLGGAGGTGSAGGPVIAGGKRSAGGTGAAGSAGDARRTGAATAATAASGTAVAAAEVGGT